MLIGLISSLKNIPSISIETEKAFDLSWMGKTPLVKPEVLQLTFELKDELLVSAMKQHEILGGLFKISSGYEPEIRVIDLLPSSGIWQDYETLTRAVYHPKHTILQCYTPHDIFTIVSVTHQEAHDVRYQFGQICFVSTATDEVVLMDLSGNVLYTWKFDGPELGCWHLNCLDVWDGRYVVSCFGKIKTEQDRDGSWEGKGVVFDLETGESLWTGLTKPHTPRMDERGRQYICNSARHELLIRDTDGSISEVKFPGAFVRGLAFGKEHIYVGLSTIRVKYKAELRLQEQSVPTAQLAVIKKDTFESLGRISLPFAEVYDVIVVKQA